MPRTKLRDRRARDEKQQTDHLRTLLSAYRRAFGGLEGEIVFDDLVAHFHDHETPCLDPRYRYADMLLVAEGQRSVIFHIRNMIQEAEKDARGESTAVRGGSEGFDVFRDTEPRD